MDNPITGVVLILVAFVLFFFALSDKGSTEKKPERPKPVRC